MSTPRVFDRPYSTSLVEARQAFLRRLLPDFQPAMGLRTALDAGCGVGYFAAFLRDTGFQVTAFDARQQNVDEAKSRHPGISFLVADVEELRPQELGCFDLVLCFGLLYHLENPLRAFRRLRALTGKLLLLESICAPGEVPLLYLRDEPALEDQALHSVAAYPSEAGLIKMAYRAGFPAVYRLRDLPDHEEYRAGVGRTKMRTVLAAATSPLEHPALLATPEPAACSDLWSTDPTGVTGMGRRLGRFLRLPWQQKWANLRRRYLRAGEE